VPPIYTELLHDGESLSLFQQFERLRLDVKTDEEVPIVVKYGSGTYNEDVFAAADVRALVLTAFGALSQNAADVVAHLFDSGRVFTNPHRSPDRGVNCVGVPGPGPFVSIPMSRCSAPLITRLAHEMGHAFQKTLAGKCSYFCHGIERLLSEAIATFFELWTLNFMLESPVCARLSRGGRLGLLATLFEDLYERTASAVYERDVFELSVQKRIEPRGLSQAWRAAHQPLLSGLYTLPPEFDHWWADHSMLFRYPLAQSYYPAATVMGLALYFRAKTNPGGFMEDFEKRLTLGGTLEFSAWEDLFGIGLKMPQLPQMVSRFVGKSLDGLALGGSTLGI
jgi:oligoendopeptidase F